MALEFNRRTGLSPDCVTVVFVTHEHGDHHAGLRHFGGADWYAAPEVARILNGSGKYNKAVIPASKQLLECLGVIATPGHTPDHHSLLFECEGREELIAGDAVMTRDFWRDRRGYFNSVDPVRACRTMEMIAGTADIIVPGHDNYFLNDRT
jgi:glyoxylase-like metal-dependent hydrolase (beta-lactamase superfamily II)